MAKILLVDDDLELTAQVKLLLGHEKHLTEVCHTGEDAIYLLGLLSFDLILLDVMLPGFSGFEVCRRYRAGGGVTPIIMLTGETEIDDKAQGFEAGIDDYLTKPFHLKELAMRVAALLRRPREIERKVLERSGIALHPTKFIAFKAGTGVALTKNEYHLLEYLMRSPNRIFTADELLDRVWGIDAEPSEEAVKAAIKRLRAKLDSDGLVLKTERGVGYYFSSD